MGDKAKAHWTAKQALHSFLVQNLSLVWLQGRSAALTPKAIKGKLPMAQSPSRESVIMSPELLGSSEARQKVFVASASSASAVYHAHSIVVLA